MKALIRWSGKKAILLVLCILLFYPAQSNNHAEAKPASPIIVSISPNHIYNDQAVAINISGAGFIDTPIVTASTCNPGLAVLSDITFVNNTTLTATVPADLPEGIYIVKVINPDGQQSEPGQSSQFTIMRRGDDTFGPWNLTSSLTIERQKFAAVATHGYVYALGGYGRDGGVFLSTVERAMINLDGSLEPWQVVGALATIRPGLAAVAVDNYIYALGGQASNMGPTLNSVERATITNDGSLGPWQVISYMTTPRFSLAAVAADGYLYALGGFLGDGQGTNTVERAEIKSDGSLGPWGYAASTILPRFSAVTFGHYIYALGGHGDNSVERSKVNPDGSLEPWQFISSMTVDRDASVAVVARGYLYVLGGFYPCIYSTNSVERAHINFDGSLGPWQLTASMLKGRSDFGAVAVNQRVYALGGQTNWGVADRSVEYAATNVMILNNKFYLPLINR